MHLTPVVGLCLLGGLQGTLIPRKHLEGIDLFLPRVPGQVFGVAAEQAGGRGSEGVRRLCRDLGQSAGPISSRGSAQGALLPLALERARAGHWEDAAWLGKAAYSARCSGFFGSLPGRRKFAILFQFLPSATSKADAVYISPW